MALRKRAKGVKQSEEAMCARLDAGSENKVIESVLDNWTKGFEDASEASIATANGNEKESTSLAKLEYKIKKEDV